MLSKDSRVNITAFNNSAIKIAIRNNNMDIVDFLFDIKKVKDTLKIFDLNIHNQLISQKIQQKIKAF
jgi:hypothetical protein